MTILGAWYFGYIGANSQITPPVPPTTPSNVPLLKGNNPLIGMCDPSEAPAAATKKVVKDAVNALTSTTSPTSISKPMEDITGLVRQTTAKEGICQAPNVTTSIAPVSIDKTAIEGPLVDRPIQFNDRRCKKH